MFRRLRWIWTFLVALAPAVDELREAFPRFDAKLDRLEERILGRLADRLRAPLDDARGAVLAALSAPNLPTELRPKLERLAGTLLTISALLTRTP